MKESGKHIAAIKRAEAYSPNHVSNDEAILLKVVDNLQRRGYVTRVYSEAELQQGKVKESVIVNMCREQASIQLLQKLEKTGVKVYNSGYGIESCTREKMTRLMLNNRVPHPDSLMVDTDTDCAEEMKRMHMRHTWVKRGDFHAMHKEDVSYARSADEVQNILTEYARRGIKRAVINRHLEGDLIKFYAVKGTDFFYWFYPFDMNHSKFGHEEINGKASGIPFDMEEFRWVCNRAADVVGIEIYGGDCIVSPEGEVKIIDLNDWPSFAPCRDEAASYIAKRIDKLIIAEEVEALRVIENIE